ncbi:Shikimate dehydrogenase (NADP(+)) [Frankliniella fusca]|uniref:Shikimate dehydrogenase (NADP(+)) n=1 Tax=Frankliniella fusca TaxID=407009 RepID=A0AAE1HB27_9NEOP|nr:Shikimate dehydrogenase (NADP(+)) [Frankliniella fusca]
MDAVREWELTECIVAVCFDTTSTNSGHRGGVCVLVEQAIGRDLLHLACRHHVFELVLGAAFEEALGHAKTPDIHPLFSQFKECWKDINKEYTVLSRAAIRRFPGDKLQPRDDYKELLQLTVIFLGGLPHGGVSFRKPGAVNKTPRGPQLTRNLYT